MVPMFPQVDALPGAQQQFACLKWHADLGRGQSAFDVSGHVIRPLINMRKHRVSVRGLPLHERFQIVSHRRIRIFAKHQRGTGVSYEDMTHPNRHSGRCDRCLNVISEIVGASTRC